MSSKQERFLKFARMAINNNSSFIKRYFFYYPIVINNVAALNKSLF